jgi:hypothetical protein
VPRIFLVSPSPHLSSVSSIILESQFEPQLKQAISKRAKGKRVRRGNQFCFQTSNTTKIISLLRYGTPGALGLDDSRSFKCGIILLAALTLSSMLHPSLRWKLAGVQGRGLPTNVMYLSGCNSSDRQYIRLALMNDDDTPRRCSNHFVYTLHFYNLIFIHIRRPALPCAVPYHGGLPMI